MYYGKKQFQKCGASFCIAGIRRNRLLASFVEVHHVFMERWYAESVILYGCYSSLCVWMEQATFLLR
jgi:hypothetical protein